MELVEVKTSANPYSMYTAIGQLLYHSKEDITKVVVFPSIDESFRRVLKRLGIIGVVWGNNGCSVPKSCRALSIDIDLHPVWILFPCIFGCLFMIKCHQWRFIDVNVQ